MKVVGWILGILVLAVVGIVTYIALNSGALIKSGVEEFGPQVLGAPVSVADVDLDLAAGAASVSGLYIGNPQGFSNSRALSVGETKIVLDIQNTTEALVVMKQVAIDGADMVIEVNGQRTNFQQLLDNVDKAVEEATGSSDTGTPDPKYIIEKFDFTNATAMITSDIFGEKSAELPDLHLTELGRKTDGLTSAELAEQILEPLTKSATRAALAEGLDIEGAKGRVREQIRDKIGSGLRGLTDKLRN